ncbi:MAG: DinB family protein [Anaerolineae bacterium]
MNRGQLFARLDKAWQALLASYAGLPEAELLASGVSGDWSVRDIIAHVTWWEEEALAHLPTILAGGQPPRYSTTYGGIDAFNEQMMKQRKNLPLAEVLRQRDEVHARLIAFLETVPEEHFARETRFRRRLRLDTFGHYRLHSEAILHWRERVPAQ